jgi:hypothetical protein
MHTIGDELEIVKDLEDKKEYKTALDRYETLYSTNPLNFGIWQHYFFLTWYLIACEGEEKLSEFNAKNNVFNKVLSLSKVSNPTFDEIADYHFIIGYTHCLFPYIFGDYSEIESIGKRHMKTCLELDDENLIYQKLGFDFSNENDDFVFSKKPLKIMRWIFSTGIDYFRNDKKSERAKPIILKRFSGKGVLNRYFSSLP